jgi:hypothetical protein
MGSFLIAQDERDVVRTSTVKRRFGDTLAAPRKCIIARMAALNAAMNLYRTAPRLGAPCNAAESAPDALTGGRANIG